jgi:hypothetical protein
MKRLKMVGAVVWALFAFAIMASSAFAEVKLPDLSITLTGGAYPIHANGSCEACATGLGSASGVTLEGKGVTLLLLTTELSALGTFNADFTNVVVPKSEGKKCNSTGDAAGVVLVSGEFHLVPISLSPLTLGLLFLVSQFTITCETKLEVVVKGNLISSVEEIGSEGTELTGFGGKLEGKEGKQSISEYYNDGGTKIKATLLGESGAGFVSSDENVAEKLPLKVLGSQMVIITNR